MVPVLELVAKADGVNDHLWKAMMTRQLLKRIPAPRPPRRNRRKLLRNLPQRRLQARPRHRPRRMAMRRRKRIRLRKRLLTSHNDQHSAVPPIVIEHSGTHPCWSVTSKSLRV